MAFDDREETGAGGRDSSEAGKGKPFEYVTGDLMNET
jgi:hypothetical protein